MPAPAFLPKIEWVPAALHYTPLDALKHATRLVKKPGYLPPGHVIDPAGLEEKLAKTAPAEFTGKMLAPHLPEFKVEASGAYAGYTLPEPKNRETAGVGTVRIKSLTGTTHTIEEVHFGATLIEDLKARYQERTGVPPDQQRIIYNGQQLHGRACPSDYDFKDGDTMHMVLRLRGGMFHITTDPSATCGTVSVVIPLEQGGTFDVQVGVPAGFAINEVERSVVRFCAESYRKMPARFCLGIKSLDQKYIPLMADRELGLPVNERGGYDGYVFHLIPEDAATAMARFAGGMVADMDEE